MILGQKVSRPTKAALAAQIADHLGLQPPAMSTGSSVDSAFLDAIHMSLTKAPTGGSDTYRKTEILLGRLGLTYDPYWDTSEAAPEGGGTVTTRAYSRILTRLTETPRCFILNVTDAPIGTRWERNHAEVYRYDATVTGRRPLNEAGPGSRVLYYATSNASAHPMHFIAQATVAYIGPGWTGPWEARLEGYEDLRSPVPVQELEMPGWNRQHAITEVDPQTYAAIVAAGGELPEGFVAAQPIDPGGAHVAERVLQDFPVDDVAVSVHVPDQLPAAVGDPAEPAAPQYSETSSGAVRVDAGPPTTPSRDPRRDKLAEQRAVMLATKALVADGWTFTADRQRDGVGYDLEFTKGERRLKVEVKGIQGAGLVFNVTPKEFWRAETDPDWVLVATTRVLSPTACRLHLITRDRIVEASRTITGYRVQVTPSLEGRTVGTV